MNSSGTITEKFKSLLTIIKSALIVILQFIAKTFHFIGDLIEAISNFINKGEKYE